MATKENNTTTVAPYGSWKLPISVDLLAQKNISFGEIAVLPDSQHQELIYTEGRPTEGGRGALIYLKDLDSSDSFDLTADKHDVRTGIHEYGGGALAILPDGSAIYSDYDSKKFDVYNVKVGQKPRLLTPENAAHRFGDFGPHPTNPELVLAILEDHTINKPSAIVNSVVLINQSTTPAKIETLLAGKGTAGDATVSKQPGSGNDFYTFPRFSPNGKYVAWISWNHPSMPFWATELSVARFEMDQEGIPRLSQVQKIHAGATGGEDEVLQQPVWAIPKNPLQDAAELFFTSDNTGFSNLYTVTVSERDGTLNVTQPLPVLPEPIQKDFCPPCWPLNTSSFVPLSSDLLLVITNKGARDGLGLINLRRPRLIEIESPFVNMTQLRRLTSTSAVFVGSRQDEPAALVSINLRDLVKNRYQLQDENIITIKRSSNLIHQGVIRKEWLSIGQEIEFPTQLPDGTNAISHAVLFRPQNPNYSAPAGTSPPCLLSVHGGPTASTKANMNLEAQYWTSRGWMVCYVNYGGSTGYGKEYVKRLSGQWGVVDIRDCVAAAEYLGTGFSSSDKPFSQLSSKEARQVRQQIASLRAERGALKEELLANGAVQVTLNNSVSAWGWGDLALGVLLATATAAATATTVAASLPLPFFKAATAACAIPWLWTKLFQVQSETVTAIPSVGLQVSTTRGLSLPITQTFFQTSKTTKLIPRDRILDLYIGEGYRHWSVIDYLAVAIRGDRLGEDLPDNKQRYASIHRLFPNLVPRLPITQKVYRTLYPALFGKISTDATQPTNQTRQLGSLPLADPNAIVISGKSAGGYAVLTALTKYPETFSAGTNYFGVSDLSSFVKESHKFESQYVYQLIGGKSDEIPDIYYDRSPIHHVDKIKSPILVLQGNLDKIVLPVQSEIIVEAIKQNHGKVKYVLFQGEGHGFRKSESIKTSLKAELDWYNDIFGFDSE